jgi:transcriptional regulator with XRE-family HTH domain
VKRTESNRSFIERVEASLDYRADVAALSFVEELVRCMRQAEMSQAELARRLGASEAYVSKVLRGDANFTLATLVKLADAVGQELRLRMEPAVVGTPSSDAVSKREKPASPRRGRDLESV